MVSHGIWLTGAVLLFGASHAVVREAEDLLAYKVPSVLPEGRSVAQEERRRHRVRREITPNMTGLNDEENMAMLRRHNELRSNRSASDMMYMKWSDELAKSAYSWADMCNFKHSPFAARTDVAGFADIGENLYVTTHPFDPAYVVQVWFNEVQDYTYETGACTPKKQCAHYTQVVWASSSALGCVVKYCPELARFRAGLGYYVVCHYGPGGNVKGEKPYRQGEVCSQCPRGASCVNRLCSFEDNPPKIEGSKATPYFANSSLQSTTAPGVSTTKRPKTRGSKAAPSAHSNLQTITAAIVTAFLISIRF